MVLKTSSHVARYVQISSTCLSQKWIRSLCLCCGTYWSQRETISCCVQLVGAINWVCLITVLTAAHHQYAWLLCWQQLITSTLDYSVDSSSLPIRLITVLTAAHYQYAWLLCWQQLITSTQMNEVCALPFKLFKIPFNIFLKVHYCVHKRFIVFTKGLLLHSQKVYYCIHKRFITAFTKVSLLHSQKFYCCIHKSFITAFTKVSLLRSQKVHYCVHKCLLLGIDLHLTTQFFTSILITPTNRLSSVC